MKQAGWYKIRQKIASFFAALLGTRFFQTRQRQQAAAADLEATLARLAG